MERYAANIRGTNGYHRCRREELQNAQQQIGPLHIFVTYSIADNHWEDLARLIANITENGDHHRERSSAVRRYPHLVDAWFSIRIES